MDDSITKLRVSPYARISDTDEERAPGIDRQLRTVHPLIAAKGAVATRDYVDNDKSAYKRDVVRDDFEAWLQDFTDNKTDGIAVWDVDRAFRQPMDLERVIQAYEEAAKKGRPTIFWTRSASFDLTTGDGQAMLRVLVTFANKSSKDTVGRVTDFYRDEALKGRVYSNYPAFYRNPDGSLNPEKARITLKAIEDVFNGLRPTAIAAEWRKAGITTARGGRVTGETVRRILTAPGIAGLAVYHGELLLDAEGQPVKRQDGGLVDEATWRALCELLKPKKGKRDRAPKSLLSDVLRCGKCGSRMNRYRRTDTYFNYGCRSVDAGGCSGVSISGNQLDKQITALVLAYLSQPIEPEEDTPFAGQARLDEITGKIAELMQAYRDGSLSGSIVFPSIKELEEEQKVLQRQAAQHVKKQRKTTTAAEEWDHIGLARQQAIIRELFEAIVIMPAKKARTGVYDPNRARPIWRGSSEE